MRRGRIALAAAAAAVAAAAILFGGVLRESSSAGPSMPAAAPPAAGPLDLGFAAGDTPTLVRRLQERLRAQPDDVQSLGLLGLAYQQRARETGDPAYYTKSAGVLRRALALAPDDLIATGGLGSLALSRHRFAAALALGRKALRISPSTSRNYGVVGDALAELGRYRDAFRAYDTMARLRPGLPSYARVAHARWLLGRPASAVRAMRLALDAAEGQGEPEAWVRTELGKIYFSRGKVEAAARQFRLALRAFPGYAYALDALALTEWALGGVRRAIALERQAVDTIPLPQYVAQLGDLYARAGNKQQARNQYELVSVIRRLLVANGVRVELETALFDADHRIAPRRTLALARLAESLRPSIDGDDVLGWALERTGRCGEALHYSKRALRLGTLDALKFFHRGMIERCLGHRVRAREWLARALALNPHFSVRWAPLARRLAS